MTANSALELAVRLVCLARLVSMAEYLLRWRQFGPGGLLNFAISRPLRPAKASVIQRIGALGDAVNTRYFPLVIALDGLCSATLLVRPALTVVILVAVITQMLLMKRNEIAIDGSDQMILVVLVASALGRVGQDNTAVSAACFFLAGNLCLAYFTAGAYKAASRQWISGEALTVVVSTTAFGYPRFGKRLAGGMYVPRIATWIVIVWECSFPATLVAAHSLLVIFLAIGIAFHISCGLIMGLTNFPLAFGAAYPSLIYVNQLASDSPGAENAWPIAICLLLAVPCFLAVHAFRRDRSKQGADEASEVMAARVANQMGPKRGTREGASR